jgi:hypothetical protein
MPFDVHQAADQLNPDAVADVIFIHGLTGQSETAWTHSNGFNWVTELSADLPEFNIVSVEFHSAILRNEIDLSLVRIAETLTTILLLRGIGRRPLVFVCHSLGGLLAKAILRHSQILASGKTTIFDNCIGIVFIGVPHRGSKLADYLQTVPFLKNSKLIDELTTRHDWIDDLNRWFRGYATKTKLDGCYFYETLPLHKLFVVVPMSSADPELDNFLGVATECDHVGIAKPSSKLDPVYYLTREFAETISLRRKPRNRRQVLCHFVDHHVLELAGFRSGIPALQTPW